MLDSITRRAALSVAVATVPAVALPALAREPDPDAELLAMGERWRTEMLALEALPVHLPPEEEAQAEARLDAHCTLSWSILDTPARTPRGAALKIKVGLANVGWPLPEIESGPLDGWDGQAFWTTMHDLEAMASA